MSSPTGGPVFQHWQKVNARWSLRSPLNTRERNNPRAGGRKSNPVPLKWSCWKLLVGVSVPEVICTTQTTSVPATSFANAIGFFELFSPHKRNVSHLKLGLTCGCMYVCTCVDVWIHKKCECGVCSQHLSNLCCFNITAVSSPPLCVTPPSCPLGGFPPPKKKGGKRGRENKAPCGFCTAGHFNKFF